MLQFEAHALINSTTHASDLVLRLLPLYLLQVTHGNGVLHALVNNSISSDVETLVPGALGPSRLSASTDAWAQLERQGSHAGASTISLDSPTSTLPAKSSLDTFSKDAARAMSAGD